MVLDSNLRKLIAAAALLLAGACGSAETENVSCAGSEAFRLEVETTPITQRLILGGPSHDSTAPKPNAMRPIDKSFASAMGMNEDHGADTPARRRSIAVISGGGEFGAYGAGFWDSFLKDGGPGADMTFDVVTGVSTGALQATAVFLRTPDDLNELVASYDVENETALARKRKNFLGFVRPNSAYSLAPAREAFGNYLTDARIDAVAEAHAAGRRLLIGAVDVQDGRFYAFDLTALAASDRSLAEKKRCYREAVFASAAIPLIFPPVLLDGRQYFDGGVRAAAFLSSAANALDAMGGDHAPPVDVYVLFNSYLEISPRKDNALSTFEALGRTQQITFNQIDRTSLQTIAEFADRFDIRWARVEPGLCREARDGAPEEKVFNTPFMGCLLEEGRRAGAAEGVFQDIK
ncbi:MAG: patatin-like phospholipase family protein [Pseudomonadota bacterium]